MVLFSVGDCSAIDHAERINDYINVRRYHLYLLLPTALTSILLLV